jgi:glutamate/tyrosine decarboxylase-like PLP-dependent enzyme
MANFTALLAALRNVAPYDTTHQGLQGEDRRGRFTLYMSDHEGHVSIVRAADMMNLGRDAVRRVPSRDDFTMDPTALERMLAEDRARGDVPFCIVAQVGSINVGAIDPLRELAGIAAANGLWLHADGACGALAAMLPEKRVLFDGLELADSVTLDPHKWLYIPYECGCVLARDPEKLRRAFSITAPYLRGTIPSSSIGMDYLEYGPQMSRGFIALKVWMTLKHYGAEGYRELLARNVRCVEHLDGLVRRSPHFVALHQPRINLYSFRYAPEGLQRAAQEAGDSGSRADAYLDRLNQLIADEIQARGTAFIMTSKVRGRVVLRMSVCSHRTTIDDIDRVFAELGELGEMLNRREQGSTGNVSR